MPGTVRLPPGGAVAVDPPAVGVWVAPGDGWLLGVTEPREMLGRAPGELTIEPRLEKRCAPTRATTAPRAIAPTANTASTIHHPRKLAVFIGGAVGYGPP